VFLNYFDVHHPYWPPEPFDTLFGTKAPRHNPRLNLGARWTPEQVASEQRYYDRCLAYLDHELSALFDELARRRQLDNTIVIISSDHGELFGEHGFMMHGYTLYPSVLHVPLLIAYPARVPPARIATPVSTRHLAATALDLAGIANRDGIAGTSLAALWASGQSAAPDSVIRAEVRKGVRVHRRYPGASHALHTLLARGYQYILTGEDKEELYNNSTDPEQRENVATDSALADILSWFRNQLPATARTTGKTGSPER
jgi:arylsulfatase A-like enzyme